MQIACDAVQYAGPSHADGIVARRENQANAPQIGG